MKQILKIVVVIAATLAAAQGANAACYADYKAKKDTGGLRLHYGVVRLSDGACGNRGSAQSEVADRIASGGWQLLVLLGTFDDTQLNSRRADAGSYFLKY